MITGRVECGVVILMIPIDEYKNVYRLLLPPSTNLFLRAVCKACYVDVLGGTPDDTQHLIKEKHAKL